MIPKFRAWDETNKKMITNFKSVGEEANKIVVDTGCFHYGLDLSKENEIRAKKYFRTKGELLA